MDKKVQIVNSSHVEKPAIHGGKPVRQKAWPKWPFSSPELEETVIRSLRSGRWAISGFYQGEPSYEEKFAKAFAAYNNAVFCIPTANGTSALLCSLQALGIGTGDEVIVPGLTWVACAVAVASLNAIPILVDVDEHTLCLSPQKVEAAITERTKAIMVVHLYNAVADMGELLRISQKYHIPLLEDCAQAHGASWEGKRVGTIGAIGTFSMQQGKILTSGEGGAAITNDPLLADRIYTSRTNARRKLSRKPQTGYMELEDAGEIFASNYCLSEISGAILLHKLQLLDMENQTRQRNREILAKLLAEIAGVSLTGSSPGTTSTSMYHLPVKIDRAQFGQAGIEEICRMLSAELGTWIHQPYVPLNKHPLYVTVDPRLLPHNGQLDKTGFELPCCWEIHNTHLLLHHSLFLGDNGDMHDIAAGIKKVKHYMR